MRGPKPKPTHQKKLEGNPGKRKLNEAEPQPAGDLRAPPEWFDKEHKDVWNYALSCCPKGLMRRLDWAVLEVWVCAYIQHKEAAELLRSEPYLVETVSGGVRANPLVAIQRTAAQTLIKTAEQMGFTPSSRSRIVLEKVKPEGKHGHEDQGDGEEASGNAFQEFAKPTTARARRDLN